MICTVQQLHCVSSNSASRLGQAFVTCWQARVTLWYAKLVLLQDSHVVHTGQFFVPEPVLSAIEVMEPYAQHNGTARVRNAHVSA